MRKTLFFLLLLLLTYSCANENSSPSITIATVQNTQVPNITPTIFDFEGTRDSADNYQSEETPSNAIVSSPSIEPTQENYDDFYSLFFRENAEGFQMIETTIYSEQNEEVVVNTKSTFRAFYQCGDFCTIFVEDISVEKVYKLQAPSFIPGRPFSNLVWKDDTILEFDQSTQPHQAVHYVVDVENQKLINAYPFPVP